MVKDSSDIPALKIATPLSALLNVSAHKRCILCGAKAIRAHAISRGKVLDKIAENGKVVSVYHDISDSTSDSFGLVGVGKVSTFSAFCSSHDQELFKPLDEQDFLGDDPDQELRMAFRTFARANWFNEMEMVACQRRIDAVATKDYEFVRRYIGMDQIRTPHVEAWIKNREVACTSVVALLEILAILKESILIGTGKQSPLATRTILFGVNYPVAASGVGIMNCDCTNPQTSLPKYFSYNIFSQGEYTFGVFSVPVGHKDCLVKVLDSFSIHGGVKDYRVGLTYILTQCVSEAFAVRPSYWSGLDEEQKCNFSTLWKNSSSYDYSEGNSVSNTPTLSIFDERLAAGSSPPTKV